VKTTIQDHVISRCIDVTSVGDDPWGRWRSRPTKWHRSRERTGRHCPHKLAPWLDQLLLSVTNNLHLLLECELVVQDGCSCCRSGTRRLTDQRRSIWHCLSQSFVICRHLRKRLEVCSSESCFQVDADWGTWYSKIARRRPCTAALRCHTAQTIYLVVLDRLTSVAHWRTRGIVQWCRGWTAVSSRRRSWQTDHSLAIRIPSGLTRNLFSLILLLLFLLCNNHIAHATLLWAFLLQLSHPFNTRGVGRRTCRHRCICSQRVICSRITYFRWDGLVASSFGFLSD